MEKNIDTERGPECQIALIILNAKAGFHELRICRMYMVQLLSPKPAYRCALLPCINGQWVGEIGRRKIRLMWGMENRDVESFEDVLNVNCAGNVGNNVFTLMFLMVSMCTTFKCLPI